MMHLVTSGTYILCLYIYMPMYIYTVYMGFVRSCLIKNMVRRFCLDSCQMLNSPDGEAKVLNTKVSIQLPYMQPG